MEQQSRQVSDERLWQMLDAPGAWLVRTDAGLLRPPRSLREALWQAWAAAADGRDIASILKLPEGDVDIEAPQIRRLTLRLARTSRAS
jgi:hypothetical protein